MSPQYRFLPARPLPSASVRLGHCPSTQRRRLAAGADTDDGSGTTTSAQDGRVDGHLSVTSNRSPRSGTHLTGHPRRPSAHHRHRVAPSWGALATGRTRHDHQSGPTLQPDGVYRSVRHRSQTSVYDVPVVTSGAGGSQSWMPTVQSHLPGIIRPHWRRTRISASPSTGLGGRRRVPPAPAWSLPSPTVELRGGPSRSPTIPFRRVRDSRN
jgi:hypothetical protein